LFLPIEIRGFLDIGDHWAERLDIKTPLVRRNSYIRESGFVVTRSGRADLLLESWLGRRAHGVKPATDVHFGVSFTAVMPGSRRVRRFKIPAMHSQLGISTSNHEPVARITGHESTDFTSEFLQRCHCVQFRISVVREPCRRFGVRALDNGSRWQTFVVLSKTQQVVKLMLVIRAS
jgi:hypothetical protein